MPSVAWKAKWFPFSRCPRTPTVASFVLCSWEPRLRSPSSAGEMGWYRAPCSSGFTACGFYFFSVLSFMSLSLSATALTSFLRFMAGFDGRARWRWRGGMLNASAGRGLCLPSPLPRSVGERPSLLPLLPCCVWLWFVLKSLKSSCLWDLDLARPLLSVVMHVINVRKPKQAAESN